MKTKEEKIYQNSFLKIYLWNLLMVPFLKLSTGTLSKKSIFTRRSGNPLKSGITLNLIKF